MPASKSVRLVAIAAALAAVAVGGALSSGGSSDVYVVQPGDSLWAIASRSGTTVAALAAANDMALGSILAIGRHLVIPATLDSDSDSDTGHSSTVTGSTSRAVGTAGTSTYAGIVHSTWCRSYSPEAGPSTLPTLLDHSASRLALRPLFVEWGEHYGVRPALLEAIAWQESGWQEGVVSGAGAVGVGQVLPSTTAFVDTEIFGGTLSATSTSDNIRIMAAYVGWLSQRTATTCDTVAAYYEGLHNLSVYGVFSMSVPYVDDVEYLLPGFS